MTKLDATYWRCGSPIHGGSIICGGLETFEGRSEHMLHVHGVSYLDETLWTKCPETVKSTSNCIGSPRCECSNPKDPRDVACPRCKALQAPVGSSIRRVVNPVDDGKAETQAKWRRTAKPDKCSSCGIRTPRVDLRTCETCAERDRIRKR